MSKRNKRLFVIFLILLTTTMTLSTLIAPIRAGPAIPEPDPENAWHWEVDAGDHLYFEGEFIITNASTGEVTMMFRDIWIYNITSIEDVTIDWLGVNEFSQVNATQYYYNVTEGELETYEYSNQELALFGYNSTDSIKHRIRAGRNGMPFLLPINGSNNVEVDILAPIINETMYYPASQMGAYNKFDDFTNDTNTNMIYFSNSTDGFFSEGYYYDNGTMNYGKAYLKVEMGDGPLLINASMKQVFDYDITDDVEWGVNIGDEIFYDSIENEYTVDDAMEWKIKITDISDILLNKTNNGFSDDDPINMVYQAVFADRFMWNGTDYVFIENSIIGAANNFYPQYYDETGGEPIMPFIWPINVPTEDFEFMWNTDTLQIWEDMPFDEITIIENGVFEFVLQNSTGIDRVEIIIDKTTGVAQSFLMLNAYGFMFYEIKTQTLVDWSVDIGHTIYYKSNEDKFYDIKATIVGTYTVYANMTWLVEAFNYGGIPLILPSGQPEYQFFSYIEASLEIWDPSSESWSYQSENIIAIANIYWPVSPLIFDIAGPPLLIPEGTSSSDLTDFFAMWSSVYDDITYNPGHILLRNTTVNRELNFYFDETSGRMTMMNGWTNMPGIGSEWNYMSIYPKFYQALAPGSNSFTFSSDFPAEMTVTMEVPVGAAGAGAALIYNYFTINPVNVPIPNGTAFAFFDQLFENRGLISGNITLTITFPSSIDINEILFFFFAFNMSGTEEWDSPPPEFYLNSVTYNFASNSIIIEMEAWDQGEGVLSAMAYLILEEELPDEIPGYNLFLISLMIVVVAAIIIRKKRRKL